MQFAGVFDTNLARGILTNMNVEMEENLDLSAEPPLSKAIQASIEPSQAAMGLDIDKSALLDLKAIAIQGTHIMNQRMNPLYLATGMLGIISQFFNPQALSEEHRQQTESMMGGIGIDGVPGGVIPDMQYSSEFWRVSFLSMNFQFLFIYVLSRYGAQFFLHTIYRLKTTMKMLFWFQNMVLRMQTAAKFYTEIAFCGLQLRLCTSFGKEIVTRSEIFPKPFCWLQKGKWDVLPLLLLSRAPRSKRTKSSKLSTNLLRALPSPNASFLRFENVFDD
jgi:hypothetical protein